MHVSVIRICYGIIIRLKVYFVKIQPVGGCLASTTAAWSHEARGLYVLDMDVFTEGARALYSVSIARLNITPGPLR